MIGPSLHSSIVLPLALSLAAGWAGAQLEQEQPAAPSFISGPSYPLNTCVVSGMKLGSMGPPVVIEHEGRQVKFCCKGCIGKFKRAPAKYLKKLDAAVIKAQAGRYPLTKCPITGKPLDSMGGPYDIVVGNRLIRLCCKGCEKRARAKAKAILKRIDQAALKAQLADYPLEICPVMKVKLGSMGTPINYLHGTTLVRFCCKGCIRKFEASPGKYLAILEAARKKQHKKGL